MKFYVARNSEVSAAELAYSLIVPYDNVSDAVRQAGEGVVFSDDGVIRAFHERHLPWLYRAWNEEPPRMRNWGD